MFGEFFVGKFKFTVEETSLVFGGRGSDNSLAGMVTL
jgi:hypothetical protein